MPFYTEVQTFEGGTPLIDTSAVQRAGPMAAHNGDHVIYPAADPEAETRGSISYAQ